MAANMARGNGDSAKLSARQRIFEVAADLFYRKGIRAVGVEEIVKTADVAKISLYRHFESKDALIVAYLENRNDRFWRDWDERFSQFEPDPRRQLREITVYLAQRTTQTSYRGCPFINYAAEFPDRSHPGHRVAEANKQEWRKRLRRLADALGGPRPRQLADGLMLLIEGAYAISQTLQGANGPGKELPAIAAALVEAQLAAASGLTGFD